MRKEYLVRDKKIRKLYYKCYRYYILSKFLEKPYVFKMTFKESFLDLLLQSINCWNIFLQDKIYQYQIKTSFNKDMIYEGTKEYYLLHNKVEFPQLDRKSFVPDEWWLKQFLKKFDLEVIGKQDNDKTIIYFIQNM